MYLCFMYVTSSYGKMPPNSHSNIIQPILDLNSLKGCICPQENEQRHILEETQY